MAKLLYSLFLALLVTEGFAFRGRWRNRDPEPEEETAPEPISIPDILDKVPDGIKDAVADVALSEDELDAKVAACQGDSGDLDPASQGKVDKVIQLMQGRRITKFLIKAIRRKLKDPESGLRKLLGAAAADPHDTDDTNEEAPGGAVNGPLIKFLMKIMGETKTVVGYLYRFGFFAKVMGKSSVASDNYQGGIPPCAITNAVMEFQRFNQLPITGKLTKETRALMAKDRCGNKDVQCETEECLAEDEAALEDLETDENPLDLRKKRYAIKNYKKKWRPSAKGTFPLYFHFENYYNPNDTDQVLDSVKDGHDMSMTEEIVRGQVVKGLYSWTAFAPFILKETNDLKEADIKIRFGAGMHGERHAAASFDGPLGVLAHMYYPKNGKMHFDAAENYTADAKGPGINLYFVTAHEAGHGLGIAHSGKPGALMGPYYYGYREPMLEQDDILAIRDLYVEGRGSVTEINGAYWGWDEAGNPVHKSPPEPTTTPPEEEEEEEDLFPKEEEIEETKLNCIDDFYAGFKHPEEDIIYLFVDKYYYLELEPMSQHRRNKFPKVTSYKDLRITERWPGLEGPYHGAVTDAKSKTTYFFSKEGPVTSWDWTTNSIGEYKNTPREKTKFVGLPDKITGVAMYRDVYVFFSGLRYYIFDMETGVEDAAGHDAPGDVVIGSAFNSFYSGNIYTTFYSDYGDENASYSLLRSRKLVKGKKADEAIIDGYNLFNMQDDLMFGWPADLTICVNE